MSFESPLPPYNASDPSATFFNSSCLDLLMIELVPMAYRIVNEVDLDTGLPAPISNSEVNVNGKSKSNLGTEGRSNGAEGRTGEVVNAKKMDEDEERDAVFFRLEMLGYRVGQGLVERYVEVMLEGFWMGRQLQRQSFNVERAGKIC
jgi:hypothetical protein